MHFETSSGTTVISPNQCYKSGHVILLIHHVNVGVRCQQSPSAPPASPQSDQGDGAWACMVGLPALEGTKHRPEGHACPVLWAVVCSAPDARGCQIPANTNAPKQRLCCVEPVGPPFIMDPHGQSALPSPHAVTEPPEEVGEQIVRATKHHNYYRKPTPSPAQTHAPQVCLPDLGGEGPCPKCAFLMALFPLHLKVRAGQAQGFHSK